VPFGVPIVIGSSTLDVRIDEKPASVPAPRDRLGRLLGASPVMKRLYDRIEKIAQSGITALIEGETGTGKELVAEAIHELSPMRAGPFVVMDCTTIPATLMESELFGHEKGSFTGAVNARRGLLEAAEGGTIFIDEIAELDVLLQPKLLRAIERREFRRIGSTETNKSTARVVAATRRDLDAEVTAGRFRDDLFHRLAIARIVVPPLRDREGDVRKLAVEFAREFSPEVELPEEVLARFESARWPGNVRELRNAVARFVALGEMHTDENDPPSPVAGSDSVITRAIADGAPYTLARDRLLSEFDRAYVTAMLERHGGNVSAAARAAGIGRRYFHVIKARIERE
jgi:DNA-binding NtrC family response regulator